MAEVVPMSKDFVLKHGGHPTVLIVSGEHGRRYLYLPDFPSDYAEKVLFLFGGGKQTARLGNVGTLSKVFLVMEAWQGRSINIRPSQDDAIPEVV